jgi:dipeptidyl aminopeptidase/acylaminoacyl peptidase
MTKKLLLTSWLMITAAAVAGDASDSRSRHAITHEDLWLLKRVGTPVPSPDGKWVVFAVTAPAYDAKDEASNLWIVATDGGAPPRQLTQTKASKGGAAWSKDGARIAFSDKREGDEVAQIYVLTLDGGEAERVTSLTLGARQPRWSPDGRQLLFVSDAFPGCADEESNRKAAKERKDRKYDARVYETFPIRFWNHWLDDRKAHLFVQEARPGARARDLFAGSKLADSPGFGPQNTDEGQAIEAEWSPDGAGVIFTAAVNRDAAARAPVRTQLFEVAAKGGEPRALTDDPCSYEHPQFSPDGRTLLCLATDEPLDKVYSLSRLAGFPWPFAGAKRSVLTESFDRAVGRFATPAGGGRVWFTSEDAGREKLYSVAYAGGDAREEKSAADGCLTGLAAGGTALVADWESAVNPPEVFALDAAGGTPRRLTDFNGGKLASLDLAPVENFWFTSSRGRKIHSMLVRPPGFDPKRKYPLFVVIHGGAASMWRDAWVLRWNYHLLAAPGYAVLLTDYTGSTGYGEEFSRGIQSDPLKGPASEINEAADEALRRFPFLDASRQAAGGASYGGHLANWLEATTTRYKCIISHAGEADLTMQWGTSDSVFGREVNSGSPIWGDSKVWREQSPALQAGNHDKGTGFVTPILISDGEQDFRVPMNNSIMFFTLQQRLQVPSRLVLFPEGNHWILRGEDSRFWYSEVHAWLAKYLK